jgi:peptidoglycan/xylan/chitin deacetylase (PgdA/CDA1 family)
MLSMQKIPILMYHSISYSTNPKFTQFAVPPTRFAEQMAYVHTHGYTPITVTQLQQTTVAHLPEKPVVLTFDDGMVDFFTEALPILAHYQFPATLYIATAFVNGTCDWLRREGESTRRMVTWEQIAQVQAAGIECGTHSHTHPQLDMLSPTLAQHELLTSKETLEAHLGQRVTSFAYPYGYYTAKTRQLVQTSGYTSACAVKHAMHTIGTHPFALPRLMVQGAMSNEQFAALLTGKSTYSTKLFTTYARMRTPIWQMVRRGSAAYHRL